MIGDYSIIDWVSLIGIFVTIALLVGIVIKQARNNSSLKVEVESLLKEQEIELHRLSKECASIKKDTKYIYDRMVQEKLLREILYQNTPKAREILDKMDLMKEVVLQNSTLTQEVTRLEVENSSLSSSNSELDSQLCELSLLFRKIHGRLDSLESYCNTEETQALLKSVRSKLFSVSDNFRKSDIIKESERRRNHD